MATPIRSSKLYPDLPPVLSGAKRRVVDDKENVAQDGSKGLKKQKFNSGNPRVRQLYEAIERENKIREGAGKLLQATKTGHYNMEACKGLFVSNNKILTLMKQLQHVKNEQRDIDTHKQEEGVENLEPCRAKIGISDIRIPLEWKEFEQVKGKLDSSQKLGVFCLFRLNDQVIDTQTLIEVDRSMMDLTFPDVIIFPEKVSHEFKLILEVYCSIVNTDTTGPSTPAKESTPMKMLRKIKKESHDLFSGSPLPSSASSFSLSSPYVPQISSVVPGYSFALAGHTHFTFDDAEGTCRTYNLTKGAVGSIATAVASTSDYPLLPLWGQICCTIMAEPTCASQPRCTGFINVQQMVSGYPAWSRLWCVLRQNTMRCWTYPEDVGRKMPVHTISLTKDMIVENAPRLTMRRPNTLLVRDSTGEIFVSFESKDERDSWSTVIRQAIVDIRAWKDSCNYVIQKQPSKFYANDNDYNSLSNFGGFHRPTETVL